MKTHEPPELPFDKKNKSNPGYAFIQFWHPLFFVDFYRKFNRKSWQNTNSTKTIEFSYGRREKKGKNLEQVENNMSDALKEIIRKYDIATTLENFKLKREIQAKNDCPAHRQQKSDGNTSVAQKRKRF